MRHRPSAMLALAVFGMLALMVPGELRAQDAPQTPPAEPGKQAQQLAVPVVPADRLELFATAYLAVSKIRDEFHPQFARPANKTAEIQKELREKMRAQIDKALQEHGLDEAEYGRINWVVSVDPKQMEAFQQILAKRRQGGSTQ